MDTIYNQTINALLLVPPTPIRTPGIIPVIPVVRIVDSAQHHMILIVRVAEHPNSSSLIALVGSVWTPVPLKIMFLQAPIV